MIYMALHPVGTVAGLVLLIVGGVLLWRWYAGGGRKG